METLKALAMNRTTKNFLKKQISESDLQSVLQAGCSLPNKGIFDNLHLTVVQNPQTLGKIADAIKQAFNKPDMKPFYEAPTLILVSALKQKGLFPSAEYGNAACIIDNIHVAAVDIGLGSVNLWTFVNPIITLIDQLELPEDFVPIAGIGIGYPADPIEAEVHNKNKSLRINCNFIK